MLKIKINITEIFCRINRIFFSKYQFNKKSGSTSGKHRLDWIQFPLANGSTNHVNLEIQDFGFIF